MVLCRHLMDQTFVDLVIGVLYADIGQSNEDSSCYFKLQPLFFMRTLSAVSVLLSFSVLIILIVAGLIGFLKGHYSS